MRALHYLVVVKRELSKKSKALNFRNSLCPFLPSTVSLYGHKNLVMTEKVRSPVQAFKMRFLQKIKGCTLFKKCTSLEIQKSLKPLLFQIERSQLEMVWPCKQNASGKLPHKLYLPKQVGKNSWTT